MYKVDDDSFDELMDRVAFGAIAESKVEQITNYLDNYITKCHEDFEAKTDRDSIIYYYSYPMRLFPDELDTIATIVGFDRNLPIVKEDRRKAMEINKKKWQEDSTDGEVE